MEQFLTNHAIEKMSVCQAIRAQGISPNLDQIIAEEEAIRDLADFTLDGDMDTVIRLKKKHGIRMDSKEIEFARKQISQMSVSNVR